MRISRPSWDARSCRYTLLRLPPPGRRRRRRAVTLEAWVISIMRAAQHSRPVCPLPLLQARKIRQHLTQLGVPAPAPPPAAAATHDSAPAAQPAPSAPPQPAAFGGQQEPEAHTCFQPADLQRYQQLRSHGAELQGMQVRAEGRPRGRLHGPARCAARWLAPRAAPHMREPPAPLLGLPVSLIVVTLAHVPVDVCLCLQPAAKVSQAQQFLQGVKRGLDAAQAALQPTLQALAVEQEHVSLPCLHRTGVPALPAPHRSAAQRTAFEHSAGIMLHALS